MNTFDSIGAALVALRAATTDNAELAEALAAASAQMSPVAALVDGAEAIYAHRDGLAPELLGLGAGLAAFCNENGWHQVRDERGIGMVRALRRDAGDKSPSGAWPKTADDPAVDRRFDKEAAALARAEGADLAAEQAKG